MRVAMETIAVGSGLEEGAGGAPGYFHGIIPRLAEDPRIDELIIYVPAWYDRAAEWERSNVTIRRCPVPRQRPLRVAFEHFAVPAMAMRDRVDVLFSPSNFRPLTYRGANVLGLHLIQYFFLDDDIGRTRLAYLKRAMTRSVRTADFTIAVTDTLRNDAIELLGVAPEKIVTVSMGPQPWIAELLARTNGDRPVPHRTADGSPYLLCISRLYALKNHKRLIEAFARASGDVPHRLVIVGGDADITRSELAAVAADNGVADRVDFLGRVPQDDVPGLYAGAAAIAYVSLYETFGHPVLEAFATETPLLTSSRGATAEVAGGAALLADPEDVDSIAAGLRRLLLDETERARLVEAGSKRVREFSWEACARNTVDVLERAVVQRQRTGVKGRRG
jgi:glycosyltransferase involved in cell wall biosynthesis